MFNFAVVKQTSLSTLSQPALLIIMILEVAVLLFLIFGIHLEVEQGTLVSIRIFGKEIVQVVYFVSTILPMFVNFLTSIMMFLLIVGTASLYLQVLKDPLLGVILTRPLSRVKLFVSNYAGMAVGIFVNIALFSFFVSFILSTKQGGSFIISPFIGCLGLVAQCLIISAICSLFALLTESVTAVMVLGVAIYFLLGPLISSIQIANNVLFVGISLLVPKTGKLMTITGELLMGGQPDTVEFLLAAIPAVIFFTVAAVLFNRRDL